jgi:hypothetical protein
MGKARELQSGMMLEGLANQYFSEGNAPQALDMLHEAADLYSDPTNKLRLAVEEIDYLISRGRKQDALRIVGKHWGLNAMGPNRQLLDALQLELNPPPPPAPAPLPR